MRGFSQLAEFLISKGADVNKKNDVGRTALHGMCVHVCVFFRFFSTCFLFGSASLFFILCFLFHEHKQTTYTQHTTNTHTKQTNKHEQNKQ
jgi:hypothetical protein